MSQESKGIVVSSGQLTALAVTCMVGFMAFKDKFNSSEQGTMVAIATLTAQVAKLSEDIYDLKRFARKERFVRDDFDEGIAPIHEAVSRHEIALNERADWMRENEDRYRDLDYRIRDLEKAKK